MTYKPEMTERAQSLIAAAIEAKEHARLCPFPDCECVPDKPGRVRCQTTGETIHFMRLIDSDAF